MKQNYLIGTTVPFSPPAIRINEFGKSAECVKLMREAGLNIVRNYGSFPFTDQSMTTLSKEYIEFRDSIKYYAENGIETLGMVLHPGQMGTDGEGNIAYQWQYPAWMGSLDDDYYFEVLDYVSAFVAKDLKDYVTYWQIGNEQDMPSFIGDMTREQNERWMQVAAHGVKKGNPNAKCCTNMAGVYGNREGHGIRDYTKELLEKLYLCENSAYDFISIDGYFGSWIPGEPQDWIRYIDEAYEATGKPVLIMEWGYSTLQCGEPRPEEQKERLTFNTPVCKEKSWAPLGFSWKNQPHSEELQAEYIRECAKIFYEHPHCMGQLFFQWSDQPNCWQCGEPDCPAESAWGCIFADGTPKKGYYALKEVNNIYK